MARLSGERPRTTDGDIDNGPKGDRIAKGEGGPTAGKDGVKMEGGKIRMG